MHDLVTARNKPDTAVWAAAVGVLSATSGGSLAPGLPVQSHQLWTNESLLSPVAVEPVLALARTAFAGGQSNLVNLKT